MRPYIGVTGFTAQNQVNEALAAVLPQGTRKVMVGVLASGKTIWGVPNKWPARYPTPDALGGIFTSHGNALNLIHYNTKEPDTLLPQLARTRLLAGPYCHGFQLNIAWPSVEMLRTARKELCPTAPTVIVLQVGNRAFEIVGRSAEKIAEKVASYEGAADYVLLDPSGGLGKEFVTEEMADYLRALTAKNLPIGLGVAGGLCAETLPRIALLAREFPALSIDAEGRLRDTNDALDQKRVDDYLRTAAKLFAEESVL